VGLVSISNHPQDKKYAEASTMIISMGKLLSLRSSGDCFRGGGAASHISLARRGVCTPWKGRLGGGLWCDFLRFSGSGCVGV
jgi:hypothetical protein